MTNATLRARIVEIRDEAIDIRSFRLAPAEGSSFPTFTAGAHIDVHLPGNLVRQYSLCAAPHDCSTYRIAVKKEPQSRGGSSAMHEALRLGDIIVISAPRNNFELVDTAQHSVLLAGGIGITPLLSMALRLQALGRSFELQYFSRSIAHTAFHDVLSAHALADKVGFHYALEPDAVRSYLRKHLWHYREGTHLYLCGPRPFMDLVEQTAAATWPPEAVHLEYFQADPTSLAGPRDGFIVKMARTGGQCVVRPDQSIVQALAECGVYVETSCEQGVCGTCLTGVLSGVPDHRDVFMTNDEHAANDKMTPCVSRSKSDVLELDL
ncbi:MAG TPA: PDR/VanB family oxidoreductase [Casimicrobiaceae bacterium]|nr:PDR/VanB family oxidoreductase [Casimicrobiaceae bacterium]